MGTDKKDNKEHCLDPVPTEVKGKQDQCQEELKRVGVVEGALMDRRQN